MNDEARPPKIAANASSSDALSARDYIAATIIEHSILDSNPDGWMEKE